MLNEGRFLRAVLLIRSPQGKEFQRLSADPPARRMQADGSERPMRRRLTAGGSRDLPLAFASARDGIPPAIHRRRALSHDHIRP